MEEKTNQKAHSVQNDMRAFYEAIDDGRERKKPEMNNSSSLRGKKETIYKKYSGLDKPLALWCTAQEQLRNDENPYLCSKYGITLNAIKEARNPMMRLLTVIRRHTETMITTRRETSGIIDPQSYNQENDEEEFDDDSKSSGPVKRLSTPRFDPVARSNLLDAKSANMPSLSGMPRHQPVDVVRKGTTGSIPPTARHCKIMRDV